MTTESELGIEHSEGLPAWPARFLMLVTFPSELFARLSETPAAWAALFLGAVAIDRTRSVGVSVGAALGVSFLFTILFAALTG